MKITEYPGITKLTEENVLLVDGDNGTKKMFIGDAILAMLHVTAPMLHRMVYRGKNLGNTVTPEQLAAIRDGSFEDLWLGDYWVINSITWRIWDFNYWIHAGDTAFDKDHLVIMPDTCLYDAQMNTGNVTTGGYPGSAMYTTNLTNAKNTVNSAFGSAVLTHREYFANAVSNGIPSAGAWYDSKVDLPNEPMMYGYHAMAPDSTGAVVSYAGITTSKKQLALAAVAPEFVNIRHTYWLRDVVSAAFFAFVHDFGDPYYHGASVSLGVRPVFAIG